MNRTDFQIFLKIFLAVIVEIFYLALRDVIDFLKIYTMNSFIKKNSRQISLCLKLYLG